MVLQPKQLDLVASVSGYLDKIFNSVDGMKVLVLDQELSGITGIVYSQSKLIEQNVVLTSKLGTLRQNSEEMKHLKCIIITRPLRQNIDLIRTELKRPKYGEYYVYFSNIVHHDLLKQLAQADENELIQEVQEIYLDYYAISSHLFSLNLRGTLAFSRFTAPFNRAVEGIIGMLLSLKLHPDEIRFQNASRLASDFSKEVSVQIEQERELFSFGIKPKSLLLVLDRREDPVTPLLTQWTYQAMVHELFYIHNNTVKVKKNGVEEQIVLSEASDPFFAQHCTDNFGDLGEAVKSLLDSYQKMTHSNKNIATVEDMQKFVDSYPEFKKLSNNVSKHVALMGELANLVEEKKLLEVSQLEQEVACANNHTAQLQQIREKLKDPRVSPEDALRLVLLFALRYESQNQNEIRQLKMLLGQTKGRQELVDKLINYAGTSKRHFDLFGEGTSLISKSLKLATRAVQGVANVYTQHKSLLADILDELLKGKLSSSKFPSASGSAQKVQFPETVVIFMVGGTTFEEAVAVKTFNESKENNGRIKVVLGGTCVHNSKTFLTEISSMSDVSLSPF